MDEQLWALDQCINDRGIPIDPAYTQNTIRLVTEQDVKIKARLIEATGLQNPNSDKQIKQWLAANSYPMRSIAKPKVLDAFRFSDA